VSEITGQPRLMKTARVFGIAGMIAGGVLFILAFANAIITTDLAVTSAREARKNQTLAAGEAKAPPLTTTAVARFFVGQLAASGVAASFVVVGTGILALVAANLAAAGAKPSWAAPLDARFVKAARFFANLTIVVAWMILVYFVAVGVEAFHNMSHKPSSEVAGSVAATREIIQSVQRFIGLVAGALKTFFLFFLGALIVRALLAIAPADEGGDSPERGARHE